MSKLEVRSIDADSVFRVFTRTEKDATRLILDVRDNKEFKKQHILLAYNIRLSAGGNNLADCSKNTYKIKWGPVCVLFVVQLLCGHSQHQARAMSHHLNSCSSCQQSQGMSAISRDAALREHLQCR